MCQDVGDFAIRYHSPEAIAAQQEITADRKWLQVGVNFKRPCLTNGSIEHVSVRVRQCFFWGSLSQFDKAGDQRVILRDLTQRLLIENIGTAITHMGNIRFLPKNKSQGECRTSIWDLLINGEICSLYRLN